MDQARVRLLLSVNALEGRIAAGLVLVVVITPPAVLGRGLARRRRAQPP